jgi:anti-sigma factor RsiW
MNLCSQRDRAQLYLDDDLRPEESRAFREHLAGCAECAAEVALYRRVFEMAGSVPLIEPDAALTVRILERVLPARIRHREWVRRLGWAYAGAVGLSVATIIGLFTRPGALGLMGKLGATASHRVIQIVVFTLNAASGAARSMASGWDLLATAGNWLAPLARAITTVFTHPGVASVLWPAAIACALLLWWMRPRRRGEDRGMRHVGVLAF